MHKLYKKCTASASKHVLVTYHIDQNGQKRVSLDALPSLKPQAIAEEMNLPSQVIKIE